MGRNLGGRRLETEVGLPIAVASNLTSNSNPPRLNWHCTLAAVCQLIHRAQVDSLGEPGG